MYASVQQLIVRHGEDALYPVADRDGDDALDLAVIEQALSDASEEINVYIGTRYRLPLATVPGLLVQLCADMALYKLSATSSAYTEEKRQRYDDALALLRRIADGKASLGLPQPAPTATGGVEHVSERRRFRRSVLGRLF